MTKIIINTITITIPAPIGNADIKAINPKKNRTIRNKIPFSSDLEIKKRTNITIINPASAPIIKK